MKFFKPLCCKLCSQDYFYKKKKSVKITDKATKYSHKSVCLMLYIQFIHDLLCVLVDALIEVRMGRFKVKKMMNYRLQP